MIELGRNDFLSDAGPDADELRDEQQDAQHQQAETDDVGGHRGLLRGLLTDGDDTLTVREVGDKTVDVASRRRAVAAPALLVFAALW